MKLILLSVAFEIASRAALAQGAADPAAQLRACTPLAPAERQACLDRLPQPAKIPERPAGSESWVISETTSPVDYAPIVTATTFARGNGDGALKQLSIHCRGGRTELVVGGGPAASDTGADYALAYRLDDGRPVQVPAGRPAFGSGIAFRGEVVSLLQSLPEEGVMAIRLSTRAGTVHDGQFSLDGLRLARDRVAAACRWPGPAATGRATNSPRSE